MMIVIGITAKMLTENDFYCFGRTISTGTNHIIRMQHEIIYLLIHLIKFVSSFDLNRADVTKSGCNRFICNRLCH